jgi:hypothetical protein
MPAGEVCWLGQAANCCPQGATGGNKLCLPTVVGISRCWGEGTDQTCLPDGQACHFSDECCNGLCLPDGTGGLKCGSTCVPLKAACTSDADCCDGVCKAGQCAPSQTVCEPLGVNCASAADCCSGYCLAGKCAVQLK